MHNVRRGKLLVWQDYPDYAGHEMMFCKMLPALAAAFEQVRIYFPAANTGFAAALAPFADERVLPCPMPYTRVSGELYRAPLRRDYQSFVDGVVGEYRPDVALLLQGRIENVAAPLFVLKRRKVPVVSYIPMAHSCREIGSKGASTGIPDLIRRYYYGLPDGFIVPSRAVAAQIRRAGGKDAAVAENVVSITPPDMSQAEARAALNVPADKKIAMVVGRLKIKHKGLDQLLTVVGAQRERLGDWRIVLVGRGEGDEALRRRVEEERLGELVSFIPWLEKPALAYAAADILLMPSRYEGVPLVLLEAMACGTPVLGSEIDVFQEYLPPTSRFSFAVDQDLAGAMETALSAAGRAAYDEARAAHLPRMNLETSAMAFVGALREHRAA